MKLDAYEKIIEKLKNATEPLSPERQKKLADLLVQFRLEHDTCLWEDTAIAIAAKVPAHLDYRKVNHSSYKHAGKSESKIINDLDGETPQALPWEK
jgi:hypothetical protein